MYIKTLKDLKKVLTYMTNIEYIIMNPKTERNIFLSKQISKKDSLEDYLNIKIILDKSIEENKILFCTAEIELKFK